jgi:hypothetical protein
MTTQAGHSDTTRGSDRRGSAPWIVIAVVLAGTGFVVWDRNFRRADSSNDFSAQRGLLTAPKPC